MGRPISEVKMIASVSGNTVTFTTPLHISYRTAWTAQLTRYNATHTQYAGVEDLRLEGGSDGQIRFEAAANSWAKNIECTSWLGECVALNNSFRVELRDSYIHDGVWSAPGGGGYAVSFAKGTSEALVENNIVRQANKVMVARSSGAGSVVAYNYMDEGFINYNTGWQEVGVNGSHMVGPHHMLFEGNLSFNYDSDDTHGNSIYQTVFRNHLTGQRRGMTDSGNARTAGVMFGSWWHTFAGNVLGTPGMTGWVYEDTTPSPGVKAIWRLGYAPIHWEQTPDPLVVATTIRQGNYDYVRNQVDATVSLPDSLYLTGKPWFFGNCVWPWVDPMGPVQVQKLPAKERFEGRTCGTAQPTPTPSPTATPTPTPSITPTPTPTPSPFSPVVNWTCTMPRVTTTTSGGKRRYVVDRGTCTGQEQ
jgi:hypothetical protein